MAKKRHEIEVMDYVVKIIGESKLMMKDLPTQDWIHQLKTIRTINALHNKTIK
jgi:hypothetical protein